MDIGARARRTLAVLGILFLAGSGLLLGAAPASAHDNVVTGVATCAPGSGPATVTWTVANGADLTETVTVTAATGGLATVSPSGATIAPTAAPPDRTATFTQSLPATTGTAALSVQGVWSDGASGTDTGSVPVGCGPTTVQTLAGSIETCPVTPGTAGTAVPGGTIGAAGPETIAPGPDPLGPDPVPAGTYTLTATAPSGYGFVACGATATISPDGSSATEPVTVPAGGAGSVTFWVSTTPYSTGTPTVFVPPVETSPSTLAQTVGGTIEACVGGAPTTTAVPGGTIGATGPQRVPPGPEPLGPVSVPAGSYTVTATAPPGQVLVACAGASVPGAGGATATQTVTVPADGSATATFYAQAAAAPGVTAAAPVTSGALAFTGADPRGPLAGSALLLGTGVLALALARRRRRPA